MPDMKWNVENMTPHQKTIADFVQKHMRDLLYLTETEIAQQLSLSNATVSRFWKSIGFENFKLFKEYVKDRLEISPANKLESILNQVSAGSIQSEMLQVSQHNLEETLVHFSTEDFQQAVDALSCAKTIYIYSPGPSEGLAHLLKFRLSRFGNVIHLLAKSGHELLESLVHMTEHDTLLIFGFVHLHPETRVLLDHAKTISCTSIVLTDRLVSDFNTEADIVLYASRGELWEFHSMVAPTFLVENIIIGVGMKQKETTLQKLETLNRLRKMYKNDLPRD
ncbi:RpiR family transcriptional regulator [Sporosarcina sp. NCCP-2222]|uniref:MurR/RpiR family transcriptional regulator n=1 Tax=Sporosarcina sp. NCCP-2222 TaxID=2935073 RepID=UPI00207ED154|nr:MurR/RpiR family transcriptional regulator [Sporosarcina sp. NCCP-2222]GKV55059.1 RpiR family transcriptional regulator [Sporosarcina sp. NCCP-2222]